MEDDMWRTPSNDRTYWQTVSPLKPSVDTAFLTWLQRQETLIKVWEQELMTDGENPELLGSVQAHKTWLKDTLSQLSQDPARTA